MTSHVEVPSLCLHTFSAALVFLTLAVQSEQERTDIARGLIDLSRVQLAAYIVGGTTVFPDEAKTSVETIRNLPITGLKYY